MKNKLTMLLSLLVLPLFAWAAPSELTETAALSFAPNVPPAITRKKPALVKVALTTEEKVGNLMAGMENSTKYKFWTFKGHVLGLFIRGCQYIPHVIGVQTGQPLEISNDDATLHNVNAQTKKNPSFNFAQPVQGMKNVKKFDKPETMIPFICHVHPWMKSYIGVVDNPFFAVSDDSGQFEIKGLPAGSYVLEAWHEQLGTSQQKIVIKAGETKTVSFIFAKS